MRARELKLDRRNTRIGLVKSFQLLNRLFGFAFSNESLRLEDQGVRVIRVLRKNTLKIGQSVVVTLFDQSEVSQSYPIGEVILHALRESGEVRDCLIR